MSETKNHFFRALGRLVLKDLIPVAGLVSPDRPQGTPNSAQNLGRLDVSPRRVAICLPGTDLDEVVRSGAIAIVNEVVREVDQLALPLRNLFGNPSSFLVVDQELDSKDLDPDMRMTEENAVAYGALAHVLVKFGQIDNRSLHDRYPSLLESDYPVLELDASTDSSGPLCFASLADECLMGILEPHFRATGSELWFESCSHRLAAILRILGHAYRDLMLGHYPWQAIWMRHVDSALDLISAVLSSDSEEFDDLRMDDFLRENLYPMFGLPNPDNGVDYQEGRSVARAMDEFWSDREVIEGSTQVLTLSRLQSGGELIEGAHPLGQLDWSSIDRIRIDRTMGADNPLLAWQVSLVGQLGYEYLKATTEEEFFNPRLRNAATISIFRNGVRSLDPVVLGDTYVIGRTRLVDDGSRRYLQSEDLELRVSLIPGVPFEENELLATRIRFSTAEKSKSVRCSFNQTEVPSLTDGEVRFRGNFRKEISRDEPFSFEVKVQTLTTWLEPGDPLEQFLPRTLNCQMLLLPPGGIGAAIRPRSTRSRKIQIVAPTEFMASGSPIEAQVEVEYSRGADLEAFVWNEDEIVPTFLDGVPIERRTAAGLGVSANWICAPEQHVIESGEYSIVVSVREESLPDPLGVESPLAAAVEGTFTNPEVGFRIDRTDIRIAVESHFAEVLGSTSKWSNWRTSCGHIAVSENLGEEFAQLTMSSSGAVAQSNDEGGRPCWPYQLGADVPQSFLESGPVENFRRAFDDLGLAEMINDNIDQGGPGWISKIDLGRIGVAQQDGEDSLGKGLARLLCAHTEMIQAADSSRDPVSQFWARFPFSVSIWEVGTNSPGCTAVLLSPLHPVRLAWMYLTQVSLRSIDERVLDKKRKRALAGTISGWNLPNMAPGHRMNTGHIAIAIDNGPQSLFAGWSLVVQSRMGHPIASRPPKRAADKFLPGSEANGLDATAVRSALRDFTATHPFLPTLVVDLAANVSAQKSPGIDQVVLQESVEWAAQRRRSGARASGVKVLDSQNRLGESPVSSDVELDGQTTLTWRRYDHLPAGTAANLRILNDPSLASSIGQADEAFGDIGSLPLRRFETPSLPGKNAVDYRLSPSLRRVEEHEVDNISSLTSEFRRLLGSVESLWGMDRPTDVMISLGDLSSALGDSDWVVAGENGVSPAAIVAMLEQLSRVEGGDAKMMWDWRPPFLDTAASDVSFIDRKPYMTVSRLPKVFLERLSSLLSTLHGRQATIDDSAALLQSIGSRGLGLAKMLRGRNRYQTHQKGAIGFALLFELLDGVQDEFEDLFAIPIDVCEAFLGVLAGSDPESNQQLADIVLIALDEDEIVLVPVEIKLYSLDSPVPLLPSADSKALTKPKNQASATSRKLLEIARTWSRSQEVGGPSAALFANGFAALFEAALKLSPPKSSQREATARKLTQLINGKMSIRVGRSVVAYLIATDDREGVIVHTTPKRSGDEREHVLYMADPRRIARSFQGEDLVPLEKWADALQIALRKDGFAIAGGGRSTRQKESSSGPRPPSVAEGDDILGNVRSDGSDNDLPVIDSESDESVFLESPDEEIQVVDENARLGVRFQTGVEDSEGQHPVMFWPGNTVLNSLNVGIVGDMGTGKTQFCKTFVHQMRWTSRACQDQPITGLILDYKGDYQDQTFLDSIGGVSMPPVGIPIDIFGVRGEKTLKAMNRRARVFVDVLTKIYAGIGNVQTERLTQVIINQIANNDLPPTMKSVAEAYSVEVGNRVDAVVNILNNFVRNEIFSTDPREFRTMEEILRDSVVCLDLKQLDPDTDTKNSLVALFLNLYMEYMTRLTKWPFVGHDPQVRRINSLLLVDEATNIMEYKFPVLKQLLLQGREYGVAIVLSSQYLNHFDVADMDYAETLRTWFIHKVPSVSVRQLNRLGIHDVTQDHEVRIPALRNHAHFYSTVGAGGKFVDGIPFYQLMSAIEEKWHQW